MFSLLSSSSLPPVCVSVGKDEVRGQLDSALQDVNVRYAVLEETEKRAVCRALIEERARYCSFVSMLKPVLVSVCVMDPPAQTVGTTIETLIIIVCVCVCRTMRSTCWVKWLTCRLFWRIWPTWQLSPTNSHQPASRYLLFLFLFRFLFLTFPLAPPSGHM